MERSQRGGEILVSGVPQGVDEWQEPRGRSHSFHASPDTRNEAKSPRTCASRQLSLMSVVLTRAIRIKFGVDEEVWRGARPDELVGTKYTGNWSLGRAAELDVLATPSCRPR